MQHIVIIGAGFGGLAAAKAFKRQDVLVTLIDQNNFHTFQPLLYQVATAGLGPIDIAHQVRHIFKRQNNVQFVNATVTNINRDTRTVHLANGNTVQYDYLVVAAGATYHDFGIPGVKEHAFALKTVTGAENLRNHILRRFELAAQQNGDLPAGLLNFVIVGAGPTGVEMAGALAELIDRVLVYDYPELNLNEANIYLIEAGPHVLSTFSERSREYAAEVLQSRGVTLMLESAVKEVTANAVQLASGEVIPTQTMVWAAGVRAAELGETLGAPLGRGSRIEILPDLSLASDPRVFAVGDVAASPGENGPLPQVAQVAIQGGKHAAKSITKRMRGQTTEPFRYRDLGSMAIVGRNAGIAELSPRFGGFRMRGFIGWLGWLFLHLIYLPGFKNQFSTLFSWAYNYLTFDRHARLILNRQDDRGW